MKTEYNITRSLVIGLLIYTGLSGKVLSEDLPRQLDKKSKMSPVISTEYYAYKKLYFRENESPPSCQSSASVYKYPLTTTLSLNAVNEIIVRNSSKFILALPVPSDVLTIATKEIIGSSNICRKKECAMGNLVADAMRNHFTDEDMLVAVVNSGGIRASIPKGNIEVKDVLSALPFDNKISKFELPGSALKLMLENSISMIHQESGRFLQVSGLRFKTQLSTTSISGKITSVEVLSEDSWSPVNDEKIYTIVTVDYVRNGGDGYDVIMNHAVNIIDYAFSVDEIVSRYLARRELYVPFLDGRISIY